jgi:hypothetical protein
MQNQEFSEEYYKMKYFKYRAKYEQLKEIAEARSGLQKGGAMETLGPAETPAGQPQLAPPGQPQPRGSFLSSFSLSKTIGMDKESRERNMKLKEDKKNTSSAEIKKLLDEIYAFASANMEDNKKERLRVRLENPCTPNKLIEIINKAPMPKQQTFTLEQANTFLKENQEKKSNLIGRVNKMCKTTLGGLNEACRMPELDDETEQKAQAGGYTLTPDSLDDINTEF